MKINRLQIKHLRNVTSAELDLSPGVNIIKGKNGAGKSSLLEAIYILARAKSFRSGSRTSPIQIGQDRLSVYASAEDNSSKRYSIGISRGRSDLEIRVNGSNISKASDLAHLLPVALVTPQSYRVIEEGPEYRRRLINWGVFHVEQNFTRDIAVYNRALLQRNSALKRGDSTQDLWDQRLVESASKIAETQNAYFNEFSNEVNSVIQDIGFLKHLEMRFDRGWPESEDLNKALRRTVESDRERGFTSVGPHRMDLVLKISGHPVRQHLSRGQQKILFSVLMMAQASVIGRNAGELPIFLFDDLHSELDNDSIDHLKRLINLLQSQTIITTVSNEYSYTSGWFCDPAMFHVEHGECSSESIRLGSD